MKKIVILGAGDEQVEIIKLAKNLGLYVISLDSNLNAPGKKFSDLFFKCNINSVKDVLGTIKNQKIDGIMVHAIELSHVVSEIASKLSLPGVDIQAAKNATNKLKRLEILEKNKIPCAKFATSQNVNEAKSIAKDLGYPVIIKPVDNAGSRGVLFIENSSKMESLYDITKKFIKLEKKILVEECLSGPEISTETIIFKKAYFTTGFSDRNYKNTKKFLPYIIEDGGDISSIISDKLQNETKKIVEKTIKALGINFGAAKGDIIIHEGKPHVIEMASRTSGGRFASHQVPAATGVNILKPLIQMSVNEKININEFIPKFQKSCSQRFVFAQSGKIKSITGIEKAKKMKGIIGIFPTNDLRIGNNIPQIQDNIASIKKIMILSVDDKRENAIKICEKARDMIKITTV